MSWGEALNTIEAVYGVRPSLPDHIAEAGKWDLICYHYISQYQLCKELGCLPKAGGLDDQDYLVVRFFTVIAACIARCLNKSNG